MELTHFKVSIDDDGVAVVLMDRFGEPINTLGPALYEDFTELIERLESDDSIKAVVFGSAKRGSFVAGADIRFFETLTDADAAADAIREFQRMFARIEALHTDHGMPVVSAIDGACLGGGLEFALLASTRIATNSKRTQLGQPEVQLGVIPAAGGTQRLPRLIGAAAALDMILSGKPVRPSKAAKMGLVDEVVPPEVLLEVARKRALESVGRLDSGGSSVRSFLAPAHLQQLALEQNPVGRRVLFRKAEERMLEETKGNYPAPERALEAVRIGIEQGEDAGFEAEARFFGELVLSAESKALRSLFFAGQMLKHATWVGAGVEARPVEKVGVLGGGLMGAGIATVSASKAGATVRIKEVDNDGVRRGLSYVAKDLDKRVRRRRMRSFEAEQVLNKVTGATDWSGFGNVDLVIEAVFEDLELKQSILRQVEGVVPEGTVFASNTSTLPISSIAAASSRPESVIGMHYFSPVEKMPLLEVVVTDRTADWATATAVEFGKRQGKTVIVVNDGTGFYTSRVLVPYLNEAAYLLTEGASIEAVDGAMVGWGFPVGPFLLSDEVGIDVGAHISVIMVDAFGDRMAGPDLMAKLVVDDRKGRKNGRGFYRYERGERGGVDESVYGVLGLGERKEIPETEIQERISLAFINEAARCLEEGILQSSLDGDIGAVMGVGYPPFRGGPFWTIDQIGVTEVVAKLDDLAAIHGDRFQPAGILRDYAETGKRFR